MPAEMCLIPSACCKSLIFCFCILDDSIYDYELLPGELLPGELLPGELW